MTQPKTVTNISSFSNRWLLVVLALFAAIWFATLGGRKLLNPDEGRYAEIPREMVASGNWLTPRLNDLKYFEKPALQYWATAVAYETLGSNEFTSRLWCGLTGLAGVFFAGWAGAKLFGRTTGIITAALLGSSLMWVILGHLNTLDMGLSFFLAAAVLAFLLAQQQPTGSKSERNWMLVVWTMTALGFLSKGVVAAVLPVLTLLAYTAIEREISAWRRLHIVPGLVVFLILTAPWFIAVSIANPEFPFFFFVHEHLQRFLTDVHERVEPWWFFVPFSIVGALPWVSLAAQSLRTQWQRDATEPLQAGFRPRRFLLLWVVVVMAFFSASHSKLVPYILPIMPALALITADFIGRTNARVIRGHLIGMVMLWLLALLYLFCGPLPISGKARPEIILALFEWAKVGVTLGLIGTAAAWWLAKHERIRDALVCTSMGTFLGFSALLIGSDAVREVRSGYDLAQQIKPHHAANKPFYSVNDYDQSLPFYLGRTMTLVSYRGEMDFGLTQEPTKGLPDAAAFVQAWTHDPSGSMAVMRHDTYDVLAAEHVPMSVVGNNIDLIAVIKP